MATESDVMRLLGKIYGLTQNNGRILGNARRVSWHWRRPGGPILVFNVVHWKVGGFFDPVLVATGLGLLPDELERAIEGAFSSGCLILVLLICQMHKFLEIQAAYEYRILLQHYKDIVDAIKAEPIGHPCCRLLARFKSELEQFTKNPDTTQLAKDLSALIAPLRCPDSNSA